MRSALRRRTGPSRRRALVPALAALLLTLLLAGCATVPGSSDVTVLRRVGEPALPSAPPGPVRGAGPLETARGWVLASGPSADRHEAARRFLTPQAAGEWDDGPAPTVVADQVDTVYSDRPVAPGRSAVRVRATQLGVLGADGAFVERPGPVDLVVELTEQNGQWRISSLPAGTVVRRSDLRTSTRPVRVWFSSALRALPVADMRYLPAAPSAALPQRAIDLLLAGPSESVAGAAVSALPPGTTVRSPVATASDGTVTVDLSRTGPLDADRRLQVARQVVLTLSGLGVARVRVLLDGAALLPGRPEMALPDVLAGVPPRVLDRGDLPVDPSAEAPAAPAPAPPSLVVTAGRIHSMNDDRPPNTYPDATSADPTGPGTSDPAASDPSDVSAATPAPGGQIVAAIGAGAPGRVRLLTGRSGSTLAPRGVDAATLTTPSWSPSGDECWVVADGTRVVRTMRPPGDAAGSVTPVPVDATALLTSGPLGTLRVSPDGIRVAAVAGGRVLVGTIVRDPDGGARVQEVRTLRSGSGDDALAGALDVGWAQPGQLVVVGSRTDRPVQMVSVDGLDLDDLPTTNLTPPVTRVAVAPGRPTLVVDQGGMWSLGTDGYGVWRSVPGATSSSVPAYPS